MIEKVIRPLIILNFGYQKSYGKFTVSVNTDPQQENLITQNLITAFSMGLVNPKTDIGAINTLREKLKLSPLTIEEQFQTNNLAQLLEQQNQNQTQYP